MSRSLRYLAVLLFFGPVSAMFAEPFFDAVLSRFGINTEEWANPAVNAMFDLFAEDWFRVVSLLAAGAGVGILGHWLATRFDRKHSDSQPMPDYSKVRTELADRAAQVARVAGAIYGEWKADASVKWSENGERYMAGESPSGFRHSMAIVDQKYIRKFGEQCAAEVWSVIEASKKFVAVNMSMVWHSSHGQGSADDLYQMIRLLGSVEASLRDQRPDLPMYDPHAALLNPSGQPIPPEPHVSQPLPNKPT